MEGNGSEHVAIVGLHSRDIKCMCAFFECSPSMLSDISISGVRSSSGLKIVFMLFLFDCI
jgi:hypothetical protein